MSNMTLEEFEWANARKDNDYASTAEDKLFYRRWCRDVVLNKLGKIHIDHNDDWYQWRGALICSDYFTEDEIRSCFSGKARRIQSTIERDIEKFTDAGDWIGKEAWLLKMLKQAGYSYRQKPRAFAGAGNTPRSSRFGSGEVVSIKPSRCPHCGQTMKEEVQ